MYIKIYQLKQLGLNVSQIARKLNISRNTVYKYLNMSPEEMQAFIESVKTRRKKLDPFESQVLQWLREYPDLSAAQIHDWLKERRLDANVCESTVRHFVRHLRERHGIPKSKPMRQYEAVEDPPMGQQMQVDFGETRTHDLHQHPVRLWCITFVLSHSRYKYVEWQDRPFTTADVIRCHENAFEFFGGMTREIVYDQDHLLLVSENHGDLILTAEFAAYVRQRRFQIRMCRKQDPESKGRVENVVGFVKRNFARHRTFTHIDRWNEDCLAWLNRTGNGRMHHTTKKIPADVFAEERRHLLPVPEKIQTNSAPSITRRVRKDNTIVFQGNRYSLPLGTYTGTDTSVEIRVTPDKQLVAFDPATGEELARHPLHAGKGKLIKNTNHARDRSKGIGAYMEHVAARFPEPAQARSYLAVIREQKPRYIRDQLQWIDRHAKDADPDVLAQALAYCLKHRLYQATDFVDALHYYAALKSAAAPAVPTDVRLLSEPERQKLKMKPQVRPFDVYQAILEGAR
jgi:transposase